jgi:hypothetical protein
MSVEGARTGVVIVMREAEYPLLDGVMRLGMIWMMAFKIVSQSELFERNSEKVAE